MDFLNKGYIIFNQTQDYLASHELGPLIATIAIFIIFIAWAKVEKITEKVNRLL